jgi:hypothetical protein
MSKFLNMNGKGNNDQRMETESHSTANGNDEITKSVSLLTIKRHVITGVADPGSVAFLIRDPE